MAFIELLTLYPQLATTVAVVLGLLVGSFLNVVIYRLPVMMEREWTSDCRLHLNIDNDQPEGEKQTFNLAYPQSKCPHCDTAIQPWQNIPVISYLLLKGQCGSCQAKISMRYPIIEAATALLSGVIVWQLGPTLLALAGLIFTWALISLTMIDADTQLLPDQITLPLMWLGLIVNLFGLNTDIHSAVIGAIIGYMSLWSIYWVFKWLTGKEGMGYGDFKLLAALGAWMGWQSLPAIILMSSLVGVIVGSALLIYNKQGRNTAIPFGPYLAIAGWIVFLWGEQIISTYLHYSGLS